jgi:hypothetical protein
LLGDVKALLPRISIFFYQFAEKIDVKDLHGVSLSSCDFRENLLIFSELWIQILKNIWGIFAMIYSVI